MATVTDDGLVFFHDCRPSSHLSILGYTGTSHVIMKFRYTCKIVYANKLICYKHYTDYKSGVHDTETSTENLRLLGSLVLKVLILITQDGCSHASRIVVPSLNKTTSQWLTTCVVNQHQCIAHYGVRAKQR